MDMRIPPLKIKILLESNPLKSRILVRRLAVTKTPVQVCWLSHTKVAQSQHRAFCAKPSALFNRRLVTTCYGFPSAAEQEHVRKSWMSRVKHPMLRLSQKRYDLTITYYAIT